TPPIAARVLPPTSPRSLRRGKSPSAPAPRQAWQSPRDRPPLPASPAPRFPTTPWPLHHARGRASSPPATVAAPAPRSSLLVPWRLAASHPPSLLFRLQHFQPRRTR